MKNRNVKRAFTLVEVLIVIVIIGILFIVLVSKVDFSVSEAKEMSVTTDFLAYQLAMEQVCIKEKQLPSDMNVLRDKLNKYLDYELLVDVQNGRLICDKEDPWGRPYDFEYSRNGGNLGKLTIKSSGGDQTFDTEDDILVFVEYKNTPYGYKVIKGDQDTVISELPNVDGGGNNGGNAGGGNVGGGGEGGSGEEPTPNPNPNPETPVDPSLPEHGRPLSGYSWAEIQAISEAGKAEEYFRLGDQIQFTTSDGQTLTAAIIGFNHDTISGSSNKAGITFTITTVYNNLARYSMNATDTNIGGWEASAMRTLLHNDIFGTLPKELRDAIKIVDKLSDTGYQSSATVTTTDSLWLFSLTELGLENSHTLAGQGSQYDYFVNSDDIVRTDITGATPKAYWARSSNINANNQFNRITSSGTASNMIANNTSSIIFGFCI